MLLRVFPHHPVIVTGIITSYITHIPVYADATLCTGQKMRVCLADGAHALVAMTGDCEPEVTQMMQTVLSKGDNVVDIGANAGLKTAIAHHFVGDQGRVLAVEPNPRHTNSLAITLVGGQRALYLPTS